MDDNYDLTHQTDIQTIDLIDFDFPPWHTPSDTLDKVSAESLGVVGQATVYFLCKSAPDFR